MQAACFYIFICFRVPEINFRDVKGLSTQQVDILLAEVKQLAESLKGEVLRSVQELSIYINCSRIKLAFV